MKSITTRRVFSEEDIKIIQANYVDIGGVGCQKLLPTKTQKQIQDCALRLGLKISKELKSQNSKRERNIKHKVDPNQFISCDTQECAYILGLIWADGYVRKNGRANSIVFSTTFPDASYFQEIFKKTGEWRCAASRKKKETWRDSLRIYTNNKPLIDFLIENDYHIKSTGSALKILQCIPKHLHKFWFLGLMDGDGYFYKHKKCEHYQCSITSHFEQKWDFIEKQCFELNIPLKIEKIIQKNGHKFSRFRLCNKERVLVWSEFLYEGHELGLPRKRAIIASLLFPTGQ